MQAALATLIGTAGSWVYLRLLMEDMDSISESTVVPFRHAQAQPQGPAKLVLQGFAAYRCASALASQHDDVCAMTSVSSCNSVSAYVVCIMWDFDRLSNG